MHVCMYVFIYIYIYIYMYTHINITTVLHFMCLIIIDIYHVSIHAGSSDISLHSLSRAWPASERGDSCLSCQVCRDAREGDPNLQQIQIVNLSESLVCVLSLCTLCEIVRTICLRFQLQRLQSAGCMVRGCCVFAPEASRKPTVRSGISIRNISI